MRSPFSTRAACAALAAALAGCGVNTSYNVATQRQETLFMNTENEVALGQAVARQVEEEFRIVRDPVLLARLDRITEKLAAVADRRDIVYTFTIVEHKEENDPNAFALPGGPIFVTTSLMELAESDDELASVLGHEMGHIAAKHSIKRMQAAMGMQLFQLVAAGTGATDARTRQGMQLALGSLMLEYSQADELESDRLGVKYMEAAGYDPMASITFLNRLKKHTFQQSERRFSYFRTHPFFADRVRTVRQEAEGQITFDDYINQKPY
ncbi:MAG: hypothetical protein COV76_06950 [Candidatus Omnitrophica bacterium CG11_big_fil_rev_8_21_14_0_20_64_10]|nr:MAG: hypothetical protein COV76_06950 [Candidatus Omnitrophica bacterium CG11_big_fil_rev_8_21_14_0_20_64_10]